MAKIVLYLSIIIFTSVLLGCGKKSDQESSSNIYVAGYGISNTKYVAKVWKNGSESNLSNGSTDAQALGVVVLDGNVYVCGYEFNGSAFVAKYWRNGISYSLTNGTQNAVAYSAYVSGSDIYFSGYESNGTFTIAKIWKNGNPTTLGGPTNNTNATSVFVAGSDIYASGYYINSSGKYIAAMWKNGIITLLTDGTHTAYATSITIINNDAYVLGYESNGSKFITKLWKNGNAYTDLSDATTNTLSNGSIASGTDLYSLSNTLSKLSIWKNSSLHSTITGNVSQIANDRSISVDDNDVYVVGNKTSGIIDTATIWKNGTAQALGSGTYDTYATSIFISKE